MTAWAILGHDGEQARALCMQGKVLTGQVRAHRTEDVIARLDPRNRVIYRLWSDTPDVIPTDLSPHSARAMPDLVQRDPPDAIDPWSRLILLGLMRQRPGWDGVAWILGTRLNQWVHLSAAEVVSVQSFLTPRLSDLLGGGDAPAATAVTDTLSRPERLAQKLHVADMQADAAAVAGHLLGAELAAARPYWLGQPVVLISTRGPLPEYAAALGAQAVPVTEIDAETLLPAACAGVAEQLGQGALGPLG